MSTSASRPHDARSPSRCERGSGPGRRTTAGRRCRVVPRTSGRCARTRQDQSSCGARARSRCGGRRERACRRAMAGAEGSPRRARAGSPPAISRSVSHVARRVFQQQLVGQVDERDVVRQSARPEVARLVARLHGSGAALGRGPQVGAADPARFLAGPSRVGSADRGSGTPYRSRCRVRRATCSVTRARKRSMSRTTTIRGGRGAAFGGCGPYVACSLTNSESGGPQGVRNSALARGVLSYTAQWLAATFSSSRPCFEVAASPMGWGQGTR